MPHLPLTPARLAAFRAAAADLPGIDVDAYTACGKDPLDPILGLGAPTRRIAFFGRDPGRDEVRRGEPFIGAGGQLVRRVIHEHLTGQAAADMGSLSVLTGDFFWINTVPYKPVGNKAWSMAAKRRFQPLIADLLLNAWRGDTVITLGREAFLWFAIDQSSDVRAALDQFWASDDRFVRTLTISMQSAGGPARLLTLCPLPHPSPLNAAWYARFPGLLRDRLVALDVRRDSLDIGPA
jgi:uracil-DNA glycosylase